MYRKDLSLEQTESDAQQQYKNATDAFEKTQAEYLSEIRERYIEEQLYSDKIRQASNWWTWGLITTHFVLFMTVQFVVEPRKKKLLKEDMASIIEVTSERDRKEFTRQVHSLMDQSRVSDVQSTVVESPEKHETWSELMHSVSYWKGVCIGSTVSFIGCAILLLGKG